MDPARWKKVKAVLEQAIERKAADRAHFLSDACSGDEQLLREVEELLDFEDQPSDPLEIPAYTDLLAQTQTSLAGELIGNYRLIEEIGSGGMGTVYLAERADGEFKQKVALKLIKRGMDSHAIIRRFVHERQILATLEHPNIARLIDGGTTSDGLPYFVMEYVDAESILDHAVREDLDLAKRLDLFRKVCSAVSFAHQNLVVHRDLKPSNILISADGTPKLLDFGIAKLLKSEGADAVTATQSYVFTPEYASPEQVRGEKLTTASDVYSLGVILYELLTGERPFRTENSNIGDIIRVVCETAPSPPSRIRTENRKGKDKPHKLPPSVSRAKLRISANQLKGDLDNIILKALRKEPERRYPSVEQFSEDLNRHLNGLPVTASADTFAYRASKYVHRNRIALAAAGLVLITLLGGMATTLYQANAARRERARAEQRFNDVRQLANSFIFEINEEIRKSPIKARALLAERAIEYLDKLAAESANDPALQSELGASYEKIGDIQGTLFNPNLGKTSEAIASHQKALELRQRLYTVEPTVQRALEVTSSHIKIGDILTMSGRIAETRDHYNMAIEILEPIHAADPTNFAVRFNLANAFSKLGQAILRSGSLIEALHAYERSLDLFQELHAEKPDDRLLDRMVGVVLSFIGFVRFEMAETDEAVNCYGKWLDIEKRLLTLDPNDNRSLDNLSTAYTSFGMMLSEQNRSEEAVTHLEEGLRIQKKLFDDDRDNFGNRISLADAQLELAKVLLKADRSPEATKLLEDAIEHYTIIWQTDSESRWTRRRIAVTQRYLADAVTRKGDEKKALEIYRVSLATFQELTVADPDYSEWSWDLATCYFRLGEFYRKTNNRTAAIANYEHSLPLFEKLSAASPENVNRRRELESVNTILASLRNGRPV
jgi:eukaryotic-like serine/threonine-protein kinase